MAIFSRIAVAATAFAALTVARPLAVRDVTSLVTETAYTTVDVPVTLWVDENGKPLWTDAPGGNFAASPTPPANPEANPQANLPTTPPAYTPSAPSPAAGSPKVIQRQTGGSVTGSSSASCEGQGNACSGDITHWDGGLGACGWNIDTSSDMQIALPVGFMGTASNGNPYCGRSVTIQNPNTGNTVQAIAGDKCMGCVGRSIDLTDALFNAIGGGCDGRCSNFVWWLN